MKTQTLTKYEVHNDLLFANLRNRLSGIAFFQSKDGRNYMKVNLKLVEPLFEKGLISKV
jgi:hypothetical protein